MKSGIALLLILGMLVGNVDANIITFDAKAYFTEANASSGGVAPWSYGSSTSPTEVVHVYTAADYSDSLYPQLYGLGPGYNPGIFYSRQAWNSFPADTLFLHSGPEIEKVNFAVLRFTAPTTSVYDVDVRWFAGDPGAVDVYLVRNGQDILKSDIGTSDDGSYLNQSLSLSVNETLELRLGPGDGFAGDSTPIKMTISTAVPEPSAVSFASLILAGISLWSRRRR
jgi:hypothetical protein